MTITINNKTGAPVDHGATRQHAPTEDRQPRKSAIQKRSIVIRGVKTSISLEEEFWSGLKRIVSKRNCAMNDLLTQIDENRENQNLSSAIRIFVLKEALAD
jgi:predicted DNA-binding ribbon-helix-helix protein